MKAAGTMKSGSRPETKPCSSFADGPEPSPAFGSSPLTAGTTYATSCLVELPARPSQAMTTACATPGCAVTAASTSPGSTRKPRTLTCASPRPAYSSWPSAFQRARSPVRYMREPDGPNGSATKRSAVSSGRPW